MTYLEKQCLTHNVAQRCTYGSTTIAYQHFSGSLAKVTFTITTMY